jgi:hypothetical protein
MVLISSIKLQKILPSSSTSSRIAIPSPRRYPLDSMSLKMPRQRWNLWTSLVVPSTNRWCKRQEPTDKQFTEIMTSIKVRMVESFTWRVPFLAMLLTGRKLNLWSR